MITLVWNNVVYVVQGDYYAARHTLGIPNSDITPWADFRQGLMWTKKFTQYKPRHQTP